MTYTSDLVEIIARAREWSLSTFGEGRRTIGVTKHIESEIEEIRQAPTDLEEWIDVVILALDGAWRAGYEPKEIVEMLNAKYKKNFMRKWPPPPPEDQPSFHVEKEAPPE